MRWHCLVVRDREATKKGPVGCSPMEMATSPNLCVDAHRSNVWRKMGKHAAACWIIFEWDYKTIWIWHIKIYHDDCGNQSMLRQTDDFAFWFPTGPGSNGQPAGADTPRNTTGHRRRAMDPNAQSFASVLRWLAKPVVSFRLRWLSTDKCLADGPIVMLQCTSLNEFSTLNILIILSSQKWSCFILLQVTRQWKWTADVCF